MELRFALLELTNAKEKLSATEARAQLAEQSASVLLQHLQKNPGAALPVADAPVPAASEAVLVPPKSIFCIFFY